MAFNVRMRPEPAASRYRSEADKHKVSMTSLGSADSQEILRLQTEAAIRNPNQNTISMLANNDQLAAALRDPVQAKRLEEMGIKGIMPQLERAANAMPASGTWVDGQPVFNGLASAISDYKARSEQNAPPVAAASTGSSLGPLAGLPGVDSYAGQKPKDAEQRVSRLPAPSMGSGFG